MTWLGHLYLLFTPALCRRDPSATLERALDGGVDVVQWRSKHADRDGFERCRAVCLARQIPLVVNDDVMLAVRTGTAGAHVGQDDMEVGAARKLLYGRLLGVSTHDLGQIREAHANAADYVGFGPCHPTTTKGYEAGVGDDAIADAATLCTELSLPMFAIGGVTPERARRLRALGVRRVAVSSHVLQHDDPRAAAAELRATMP